MTTSSELKRTALHAFHVEHGGKMVDFTGWSMPLHYGSIIDEHRRVRSSAGLFDVSHMGRLRFTGPDAVRFLDRVCTRQVAGMADGQARYGLVLNERGGCRDDVLVYRVTEGDHRMVCNAANRTKLLEHFQAVRGDLDVTIEDHTEATAMIAVQGPKARPLVAGTVAEAGSLKRYRFTIADVAGHSCMVSRTGYTGEDGVEVIAPAEAATAVIDALVGRAMGGASGDDPIVGLAGLGARDSLRLEAGMALYGHEITEDVDPLSAGLRFAVTLEKGDDGAAEPFIGQQPLRDLDASGLTRTLMGLTLDGRRAARQGMAVRGEEKIVGVVTSGCLSPTLNGSIAMALLETAVAEPGRRLSVDLGRAMAEAEVVSLPFYTPGKG